MDLLSDIKSGMSQDVADALVGLFLSDPTFPKEQAEATSGIVAVCHGLAYKSGWWTKNGEDVTQTGNFNVPEKLCLIHSEISEAMEGFRKDLMDDHLPHRKMVEVELADAVIRIFDLAGALRLDIGGAMVEKLAYNQKRADHRPENREQEGGKKF